MQITSFLTVTYFFKIDYLTLLTHIFHTKACFTFNSLIPISQFLIEIMCAVGLDSSVGTATRYGLDDPGIESRCGRDFPHSPSLLQNRYRLSFLGVKRPGRGVNHRPPSSAEVKERVELYIYFPCGSSRPITGRTLTSPTCATMPIPTTSHSPSTVNLLSLTILTVFRRQGRDLTMVAPDRNYKIKNKTPLLNFIVLVSTIFKLWS